MASGIEAGRSGHGLSTRSTGHVGPASTMPTTPLPVVSVGTPVGEGLGTNVTDAVARAAVGLAPAGAVAEGRAPPVPQAPSMTASAVLTSNLLRTMDYGRNPALAGSPARVDRPRERPACRRGLRDLRSALPGYAIRRRTSTRWASRTATNTRNVLNTLPAATGAASAMRHEKAARSC
jgi:hypothetical protein